MLTMAEKGNAQNGFAGKLPDSARYYLAIAHCEVVLCPSSDFFHTFL
jgi:hypothetical protein